MQIAIFSDVHGNLPALKAVLKDIKKRKIKQKFCLGDLVDFAPWGNEVIEKIRKEKINCLLGNHDERIAFNHSINVISKHSLEESEARIKAIEHSQKNITKSNKKFLSSLPFSMQLNYKIEKKHWKIQLVHAELTSNETYLYENEKNNIFESMLEKSCSDVIVMGHTHKSFIKITKKGLAINCGSVGRTKENNSFATYTILTILEDRIIPEIIKIKYPIEETIIKIRTSEIPNYYAAFLEKKHLAAQKEQQDAKN